jgi:hypothetical protein
VRAELVKWAVSEAEKLNPSKEDFVFFHEHQHDLRVLVDFIKREIHIMTAEEAKEAGLLDIPSRDAGMSN